MACKAKTGKKKKSGPKKSPGSMGAGVGKAKPKKKRAY